MLIKKQNSATYFMRKIKSSIPKVHLFYENCVAMQWTKYLQMERVKLR